MSDLTQTLWQSLPIPALILDGEDCIALVNPPAEDFLNASERSLIKAPVWDRIFVDAPLEDALNRVRTGQSVLMVNGVDVGTGNKKPVKCDVQLSPLAGQPDHVLLVFESREFAGRLDRALSSKSAAKSAIGMAEMLAHEIKNPLAGITGAAQLISMSLSGEDLELTDLIVAETRRIVKLLDQVEEFGNVRPPECRSVNIHDILDRARKSAMVSYAANMRLVDQYDPSLPPTWGDPDQLLQVFMNLIKNASEAGHSGGTITIRTFYEAGFRVRRKDGTGAIVPLQIEIIDDGPGIPHDMQQDIFEPFVSGRENGTGLGLALVSKIISDHDGLMTLDSVPGRTVFRISLPVAPKQAAQ